MKLRSAFFALVLGALTLARAAEPNFEFTGLISADGKTRFALTDKSSDVTEWVELGAEFKGFSVAHYEAKEDRVVLKKAGREYPLRLTAPNAATRTRPAPAPAGAPTGRTAPPSPVPAAPPAVPPITVAVVPVPPVAPATPPLAPPTPPSTPVALPPPPREPESPTYVIQGGDTWEKISRTSGVSVEELQRLNPVIKGSSLPSGQTIRIK